MTAPEHVAVLLAGGRATRLDGVDKTSFVIEGRSLLGHALHAARGASARVVVGLRPGVAAPPGTLLTREDPPWSGPVAAVAAGLAALEAGRGDRDQDPGPAWALVLACDVPRIADAVAALLDAVPFDAALPGRGSLADGYVAVDDDGRRQPLLALYRIHALRERLGAIDPVGASMRLLLDGLDLTDVPVRSTVTADVDTADDARRYGIDPGSAG